MAVNCLSWFTYKWNLPKEWLYKITFFIDYLRFMKNERKSVLWKLIFFNFCAHASSNSTINLAPRCWQKLISKVEFNWKDDTGFKLFTWQTHLNEQIYMYEWNLDLTNLYITKSSV